MENKNIRRFEIGETAFRLDERGGHLCLTSLYPEDGHEHHWAVMDTGSTWRVFKGTHYRMTFGSMAPESAAKKLLACDRAQRALLESLGID